MKRPSLRAQLMLLYAGPFLVSGALLVSVPLSQTSVSVPATGAGSGVPPGAAVERNLQPIVAASALGLAVMGMVALVLGWMIAGWFLRPVRTITETARDISASNLHRRLGPTGRDDEFARLAETLDELFERLEASFTAQRDFVANASHELRTPLTAERTLLQVALADPDAGVDSLRAACRDVLELGAAQERLINGLLLLAGSERGIESAERVDLARAAGAVLAAHEEEAETRGVRVKAALGAATVTGDPILLKSLVTNLVENALRHNVAGGWAEVETAAEQITVRNTGPVIPAEDLDRLLRPFQRLGRQRVGHGGGYGLGLAIVRAIVVAHGARLSLAAPPDGGLHVSVYFDSPRVPARPAAGPPPP
ncbi:ATP-binding protein [Actinoplanes sp. NPDC024001]|uniref:sensor histidine kinase n=1 Tax=Actinoplanes sp. NPDC024001 TaxID=3154598 RepID=UPI0033FA5C55